MFSRRSVLGLLFALAGISFAGPPRRPRAAPPGGPVYLVPFDSISKLLLNGLTGCTIVSTSITWKARASDGQIIWTIQVAATPFGTSTTFPIGTTLAQVKDWAIKWQACTAKPVTVTE
jgi:hypothetical protein